MSRREQLLDPVIATGSTKNTPILLPLLQPRHLSSYTAYTSTLTQAPQLPLLRPIDLLKASYTPKLSLHKARASLISLFAEMAYTTTM